MGDLKSNRIQKVTKLTLFAGALFVISNTNIARQAFDHSWLPIINHFDLQKLGFDRRTDQSDSMAASSQFTLPPQYSGNQIITDKWRLSVFEIKQLGRQLNIHGTGYDASLGQWVVVGFKVKNIGQVADNIYSLRPVLTDSNGETYESDALASGFYAESQGVDLLLSISPDVEAPFYLVFDAPTDPSNYKLKINPF